MRCRCCQSHAVGYSHYRDPERPLALLLLRPYRCPRCRSRYLGLTRLGRRLFLVGSTRRHWLRTAGLAICVMLGTLAFAFGTFKVLDQVSVPTRALRR